MESKDPFIGFLGILSEKIKENKKPVNFTKESKDFLEKNDLDVKGREIFNSRKRRWYSFTR